MNNYTHNVPTIEQQTGWERPDAAPLMICQDHKFLNKVSQHNFDLSDDKFLAYIKSRIGYCLSKKNIKTLNNPDAENYFLTSPDLKYINDADGNPVPLEKQVMVPLDSPDREHFVLSHRIIKARIQDSYELFVLQGQPALSVPGVDHAYQAFVRPVPECNAA